MTNEWGPPLTGEEMKALKGRIDPAVLTKYDGVVLSYQDYLFDRDGYHLPANHPYYKVREYNQAHPWQPMVLYRGDGREPKDWNKGNPKGGEVLLRDGRISHVITPNHWVWVSTHSHSDVIAYTPKPKESEVTEQMPSDEAIEVALKDMKYGGILLEKVKAEPDEHYEVLVVARLIQQYEPDRLKPAVDVAAEEYVRTNNFHDEHGEVSLHFKAGAVWRKENPNV